MKIEFSIKTVAEVTPDFSIQIVIFFFNVFSMQQILNMRLNLGYPPIYKAHRTITSFIRAKNKWGK